MTTQKSIMFEVGIMKLCIKKEENQSINSAENNKINENTGINLDPINNRISNIETVLKKIINNQKVINNNAKNVDNISEKKQNSGIKSSGTNINLQNLMTEKSDGKKVECWGKIVGELKETGKVMLYSNLANSNAIELNDMTVGINFPEGLTPFGKSVIGKSENISEISKLVSMEYGKPMQIRLIDNSNAKNNEDPFDNLAKGLDLPINIIE